MLGSPPVNWSRLIVVIAMLVIAVILERFQIAYFSWTFDFALALLIVAALFLSLADLFFLLLVAIAILASKPSFSLETILLIALPLAAYWGKKVFSLDPWIAATIFITSGVLLFYFILGPSSFFIHWALMLNTVFGSLVFGSISFFILENLYRAHLD